MHQEKTDSTRRVPGWLLVVTVLLLLTRIVWLSFEYNTPFKESTYVGWVTENDAITQLNANRKPICFIITNQNSPACKEMETSVLSNIRTAEIINKNFSPVRIFTDNEPKPIGASNRDARLLKEHHIRMVPSILIVWPEDYLFFAGYQPNRPLRKFLLYAVYSRKPKREQMTNL